MHAIEITKTGGPEVLRYVDAPQPTPGHGELLIEAQAIGVNFIDTYFRSGQYPRELPFIVGSEVCGTVVALGEGAETGGSASATAWSPPQHPVAMPNLPLHQ